MKIFKWIPILAIWWLISEAALVLADPWMPTFYQYDPDVGFRVRPGTLHANQRGFNDRDYSLAKPAGVYRIVVLGDSFSWAGGREGNYTALLEQRLAERFGVGKVEVINAGFPMTHTGEQLKILKKWALDYQPDAVLIGFFAGNDFVDADLQRKRLIIADTYLDINPSEEFNILGYPLIPRSILWNFLAQHYKVIQEFWPIRTAQAANEPATPVAPTFTQATYFNIVRGKLDFCEVNIQKTGRFKPHIAYIESSLTAMQALLHARGIDFWVAVFPDEFQADPQLLNAVTRHFGLDPTQFQPHLAQTLVTSHLKSLSINYLDMLPAFQQRQPQQALYLPQDTHWNAAGNQLAAELLFDFLLTQAPMQQLLKAL